MNMLLSMMLLLGPVYAEVGTTSIAPAQTNASTEAAKSQVLTDGQIMKIVETANEGEIDAGKHAKKHAENEKVKHFAEKMVDHHKHSNEMAKKLLKQNKLKAETNWRSKELETTAKAEIKKMKPLEGSNYDKTYIQSQIMMHETVLNSLDNELIPNAKNEELKRMLQENRQAVSAHLQEAKTLQATL